MYALRQSSNERSTAINPDSRLGTTCTIRPLFTAKPNRFAPHNPPRPNPVIKDYKCLTYRSVETPIWKPVQSNKQHAITRLFPGVVSYNPRDEHYTITHPHTPSLARRPDSTRFSRKFCRKFSAWSYFTASQKSPAESIQPVLTKSCNSFLPHKVSVAALIHWKSPLSTTDTCTAPVIYPSKRAQSEWTSSVRIIVLNRNNRPQSE